MQSKKVNHAKTPIKESPVQADTSSFDPGPIVTFVLCRLCGRSGSGLLSRIILKTGMAFVQGAARRLSTKRLLWLRNLLRTELTRRQSHNPESQTSRRNIQDAPGQIYSSESGDYQQRPNPPQRSCLGLSRIADGTAPSGRIQGQERTPALQSKRFRISLESSKTPQ